MRIYWYILLSLLVWGCEKQIPYNNADFESKLVVNAVLEADKPIVISLSKSVNPVQNPSLTNLSGEVTYLLIEDSVNIAYETVRIENGQFTISKVPKFGSVYELQVVYMGLPPIKMLDTVPKESPIFEINSIVKQNTNCKVSLSLSDNSGKQLYMILLNAIGRKVVGADTLNSQIVLNFLSNDKVFLKNINNTVASGNFAIFDDKIFNGTTKELELTFDGNQLLQPDFIPSEIAIQVCNISSTMYEYYVSLLENNHIYGGPLATYSLTNGNVTDGLGLFAFYTSTTKQTPIP